MKKGVLVKALFRKKKGIVLLVMLVILLSLTQIVSAVLITPQNIELDDFSSTQEQVITIINNQFEPIACEMHLDYLSSYLEEYVIFEPNRFILQPGEQKNVKAISSFPKDLSPQTHKVIIRSSKTNPSNSTIFFRPVGSKRSELVLANVVENSSDDAFEDIMVSLELNNEGNTILFVTPTLEIKQNSQLVREIVYPQPLILQVGESYPLTLRQDTSEFAEGNYQIIVRALYSDNEEKYFSKEHILEYEVLRVLDEKGNSNQGRNIIIGLIVGAIFTITIIWVKPKRQDTSRQAKEHNRPLTNVHEVKHEIHHLKKEISHLTKEVSSIVEQAEQIKNKRKR